jgi:hypothetical protein
MSKISGGATPVDLVPMVRRHFQRLFSREFPNQPSVMADNHTVVDREEITKELAKDLA